MMLRRSIFAFAVFHAIMVFISCSESDKPVIIPIIDPGEHHPEFTVDAELVEFFSEFMQGLAEDNNFNGVILFARDERILIHRAYGIANRASGEPITLDTKFNLASASKMFTTVCIAKLAEENRLDFDDPVGKYLDTNWVSEDVGQKVLISHLLSHTSGLGLYWDEWEKWDKCRDSLLVIDDYQEIISDDLSFDPGTDGQYSNSGFILLGAIIESITGRSYYEYVEELIFKPFHMENTGFFRNDRQSTDRAVGYFEDENNDGILANNLDLHGTRGASAGGGWSTASNMHRFMQLLAADSLISSTSREYLTTPNGLFANYGYGLQLGPCWYGHWGGFPGIEAFVMYFPQTGHTLIVFSNYFDSALPLLKKLKFIYEKICS